jgi:hypothetical protein
LIWEDNLHTNGAGLIAVSAHDIVVRNNIFQGTSRNAVEIKDSSDYYNPKNNWVFNNACGSGDCTEIRLP